MVNWHALGLATAMSMAIASPGVAQGDACANAATQAAMTRCAGDAAKHADDRLNRTYRQVGARLSPAGKARLRDAQRAWLAFRDKECAFESNGSDGGSVSPMVAANCVEALTLAREKALAAFRTCAEGDVSCPS